ncbi:hypothetical protein BD413DRAFT_643056 [Trametes elegans]|nr:hypothetical protein BD413DRAFT_643056 [Trametes elegans]
MLALRAGALSGTLPTEPEDAMQLQTAVVKASLKHLVNGTISFAVALFYFSTPTMMRQPVFMRNVISVFLGLGRASSTCTIWCTLLQLAPARYAPSVGVNTAFVCFSALIPLFTESILLIRVHTVFPPRRLAWPQRLAVHGTITAFKTTRVAIHLAFLSQWRDAIVGGANSFTLGTIAWHSPGGTSFTFLLFLSKLRSGMMIHHQLVPTQSVTSAWTRGTYVHRLRTLFWIAVSNYVFPVILNLIQLVYAFKTTPAAFVDGTCVFLVDKYVEVIGTILATTWSCTCRQMDAAVDTTKPGSSIRFAYELELSRARAASTDLRNSAPSRVGTPAEHEVEITFEKRAWTRGWISLRLDRPGYHGR